MGFFTKTRAFRRLIWLAVALGVLASAAIGLTISGLRDDAIAQAAREQRDLAVVFGREISASNRSVEQALDSVEAIVAAAGVETPDAFRQKLSVADVTQRLADVKSRAPGIDTIALVADNGDVVASTLGWPAPNANIAHADDFLYLSGHVESDAYVGSPSYSRLTNDWLMHFGRRVATPEGTFLGIIRIGVRLSRYEAIYTATGALNDTSIELIRRDGSLLVSYPAATAEASEVPFGSPWRRVVANGGGVYFEPDPVHGRQLVTVELLANIPLVVDVRKSESEVLAAWRARALEITFGAVIGLASAALLAIAASRQFRQLLESEASLAALNARFSLVLDNMPHGVALFGPDRRVTVASRRYAEMYELDPSEIGPGTPMDDVLAKRVARGIYVGNADDYIKSRLNDAQTRVSRQWLDRLSNGKIFSIVKRPLDDGGWLTIHEDVTARKIAEDRIERMALYDQLTGAANRSLLLSEMSRRLEGPEAGAAKLALLLVDLDEFKAVNDTHGHPFGDALLKAVARRLKEAAGERALVARIGGDEFAVLQLRYEREDECSDLADALLEAVRRSFSIDGFVLSIRPSVGVARAPKDGADVETLFKSADLALYSAKSCGRDRIGYFEPRLERDIRETRLLKMEIAEAIGAGQFELHYQPIIDARSRQILEMEALVRWRHPTRGLVRPDTFIKVAEESGLIHGVGEFVILNACKAAASWPAEIGVSVNLSPAQFSREDVVRLVERALDGSGLAPGRLTIEITETALMENLESGNAILQSIRALGARVALDDFGAGYSSLNYLHNFALDKIKIDRAFVNVMETNPRTREIVALIAAIARSIGASTVAEGVESQSELDLVVAAGCSAVQGYFISRPLPIEELAFRANAA